MTAPAHLEILMDKNWSGLQDLKRFHFQHCGINWPKPVVYFSSNWCVQCPWLWGEPSSGSVLSHWQWRLLWPIRLESQCFEMQLIQLDFIDVSFLSFFSLVSRGRKEINWGMWPVTSVSIKPELSKHLNPSKHAVAITSLRYSHHFTF